MSCEVALDLTSCQQARVIHQERAGEDDAERIRNAGDVVDRDVGAELPIVLMPLAGPGSDELIVGRVPESRRVAAAIVVGDTRNQRRMVDVEVERRQRPAVPIDDELSHPGPERRLAPTGRVARLPQGMAGGRERSPRSPSAGELQPPSTRLVRRKGQGMRADARMGRLLKEGWPTWVALGASKGPKCRVCGESQESVKAPCSLGPEL